MWKRSSATITCPMCRGCSFRRKRATVAPSRARSLCLRTVENPRTRSACSGSAQRSRHWGTGRLRERTVARSRGCRLPRPAARLWSRPPPCRPAASYSTGPRPLGSCRSRAHLPAASGVRSTRGKPWLRPRLAAQQRPWHVQTWRCRPSTDWLLGSGGGYDAHVNHKRSGRAFAAFGGVSATGQTNNTTTYTSRYTRQSFKTVHGRCLRRRNSPQHYREWSIIARSRWPFRGRPLNYIITVNNERRQ